MGDTAEELGGRLDDVAVFVAAEIAFFKDFECVDAEFEVVMDVEISFYFSGEASGAAIQGVRFVEAFVISFEGVFDAVLDVFDVHDRPGVGEGIGDIVGEPCGGCVVAEVEGGHGLADGCGDLVLVEGNKVAGAFPHPGRHRFRNIRSL